MTRQAPTSDEESTKDVVLSAVGMLGLAAIVTPVWIWLMITSYAFYRAEIDLRSSMNGNRHAGGAFTQALLFSALGGAIMVGSLWLAYCGIRTLVRLARGKKTFED